MFRSIGPVALAAMATLAHADSFTALGPVGGSVTGLIANGQSGDASLSVGTVYLSSGGPFPYTWHVPSTIGTQLPLGAYRAGAALGTSLSGKYVSGFVLNSSGQDVPALWSGGVLGTLPLPGAVAQAQAVAVSGQAETVVGVQIAGSATLPFYWSSNQVHSVSLPNGGSAAQFLGVTVDGKVLSGTVLLGSAQYASLYSLTNGAWATYAPLPNRSAARLLAVTLNGTVAFGDCANLSQGALTANQSVRLANGNLMSLGAIGTSTPYSTLHAVSSNGFIAVGAAFAGKEQDSTSQAVLWDSDHGLRSLKSLLIADGVQGLANWRLVSAYGLSSDGHTICGLGVNPNGAYQAFQATIEGNVGPNLTNLTVAPTSMVGGSASTGTVTLNTAAPSGGLTISLSSSSTSIKVPASITVAAGAATATFSVTAASVSAATTATIGATRNAVTLSTQVTVVPKGLASLTLSASSIYSGQSLGYNLVLAAPAPTGGATVTIQIGSSTSFTMTVPAGQSSASIINGLAESASNASIVVSASYNGNTVTAPLKILAPIVTSASASATSIKGGTSFTLTVNLTGYAPPQGLLISLSSSSSKVKLTSPMKLSHGAGQQTATESSLTVSASTKVTITAKVNGSSKTCTLTLTH